MSGIKPRPLADFYRALRARGESTDGLAQKLNCAPAVVRKLIGLLKRRRGHVWMGLQELLTPRERQLLADVEQCSAWNKKQVAKRPTFTREKIETLRETYHCEIEYSEASPDRRELATIEAARTE